MCVGCESAFGGYTRDLVAKVNIKTSSAEGGWADEGPVGGRSAAIGGFARMQPGGFGRAYAGVGARDAARSKCYAVTDVAHGYDHTDAFADA